jgi:hypothetical protein
MIVVGEYRMNLEGLTSKIIECTNLREAGAEQKKIHIRKCSKPAEEKYKKVED